MHTETAQINTQWNTHEFSNNTQSGVYFPYFSVCIIFTLFLLNNLFAHSRLNIFARRVVLDNFVQNPRKGNRMLVGKQIHPNPLLTTGNKILCQKLHILAIERCPRHMLQRKNR